MHTWREVFNFWHHLVCIFVCRVFWHFRRTQITVYRLGLDRKGVLG